jgi:hypothetical protein
MKQCKSISTTLLLLIFLMAGLMTPSIVAAQEKFQSTDHITVEGRIQKTVTLSFKELAALKTYSIDSIIVTNHLGEYKSTVKGLRGILLTDALNKVVFDAESPKVLSEYYLTCIASDGYKVVFSWNELFNTATGRAVYLITEGYGSATLKQEQQIAMVVPSDFKTGRRFVKALTKISISRVP